jgi:disulfide bond formation protein DsbB
MYSMVFIIPTGIILKDNKLNYYSAVLSFFGGLVALYHNLIYFEIIKTGFKICTSDLSCKSKQLSLFGFLSIPTMSLIAFVLILTISLRSLKNEIK